MLDESSIRQLRIIQRQAAAYLKSVQDIRWSVEAHHYNAVFTEGRSIIERASVVLKGTEYAGVVPIFKALGTADRWYMPVGDLRAIVASLDAGLRELLDQLPTTEDPGSKIAILEARLAEAEARSITVKDDELRGRCVDLLLRPGKADTAVRDAAVVLEDRVRKHAGLANKDIGVVLIDKALNPKTGLLEVDGTESEKRAVHELFRGTIGFFKNPTSHRIVADYDTTRARQIVGLIDTLLQMLSETRLREAT
jgi:uncharacterized protein (TIGR02391 family)